MEKYKDKLSEYFQIRKRDLDMFNYSIIKVSNKELADELYLRIKEKESEFEDIAYEFSEDNEKYSSGKNGGFGFISQMYSRSLLKDGLLIY